MKDPTSFFGSHVHRLSHLRPAEVSTLSSYAVSLQTFRANTLFRPPPHHPRDILQSAQEHPDAAAAEV